MDSASFRPGDQVTLVATRDEVGTIIDEPKRIGGSWIYKVRMRSGVARYREEDLTALDADDDSLETIATSGRFGRLEAFRRAMAVERILSRNRSTIYAFRAERILFNAHQYRPLLKFLDSLDRRLLIADEVGVGKTIEAGLILTELQSRQDVDRVLVVCPSRLRQKWREEMNRKFGQDFDILDGARLRELALDARAGIARAQHFRAIVSQQTLRRRDLLDDLLEAMPPLDLVIVDEAHHGRNPDTSTSAMVRDLGEATAAMLLLTATPIHLSSRDLFTLLQALRPSEFTDPTSFDSTLTANEAFLEAAALARGRNPADVPAIAEHIERAAQQATGRPDPLALEVIRRLRDEPPATLRDWIDLDRQLEELHFLSPLVTRTRKRDVIENAPLRVPCSLSVDWTEAEEQAYAVLMDGRVDARGTPTSPLGIGSVQRARQAASCLKAAIAAAQNAAAPDDDESLDLEPPSGVSTADAPPPTRISQIDVRQLPDTKLEELLDILAGIRQEEPGAKVLIFTFFRSTAAYLERELNAAGHRTLRIAGDVKSTPNRPETDERARVVERFRRDPEVRVLVSTEVGSEGLDFQFCHHLVNYDLPWNPMVVEQRIGRIDRFGQKAQKLGIFNLYIAGSVEDRIFHRLYERIGIFERSLGALDPILGEAIGELQERYFSAKLDDEETERVIEQAAQALENRRKHAEQLEREAVRLMGHEDHVRDELGRVARLGRFLTPDAILAVLRGYLQQRLGRDALAEEAPGIWSIPREAEIESDLRSRVHEDDAFEVLSRTGRGDRIRFALDGEFAYEHEDVELLNARHPLVRIAADRLSQHGLDPMARAGAARLGIDPIQEPDLPAGFVHIVVFVHDVKGARGRAFFDAIGAVHADGSLLVDDTAERLLFLTLSLGEEYHAATPAPPLEPSAWDRIEAEAFERNRRLDEREKRENDALCDRHRAMIERERDHMRARLRERIDRLKADGKSDQVVRMNEGQLRAREARFADRIEQVETKRKTVVSLSDPIAVCVVHIEHTNSGGT